MSVRSGGLCPFVVCLLMVGCGKANSHLAARVGKLQKPGTVRARSFVLVDEAGKTRVMLGAFKEASGLALFDKKGTRHVGLGVFKEGLGLSLYDEKFKERASLTLTEKGNPCLTLSDKNGTSRTVLGCTSLETIKTGATTQTGESNLSFFDKQGKVIRSLP